MPAVMPTTLPPDTPTGTLEEAVYKRQIYKQQQANMVIDGAQEPRYWEGVQVRRCSRQHKHSSRAVAQLLIVRPCLAVGVQRYHRKPLEPT